MQRGRLWPEGGRGRGGARLPSDDRTGRSALESRLGGTIIS